MLEVVNNCNGFSLACEYFLVDKNSQHSETGEYLYISDLKGSGYKNIKKLIKQFLGKYPNIKYMYANRGKRGLKLFHSRRQYEKLTGGLK